MTVKEYTLYIPEWRCGRQGDYALGEGDTQMLNEEGFMCCLGQFALQEGVDESDVFACYTPAQVADKVGIYDPKLVRPNSGNSQYQGSYLITDLTGSLMDINDDTHTTPVKKIRLIREELSLYGITLNVVDPNGQLKEFES